MKRKHLLKSSAALLLALGVAAAPLAPIVPLAPAVSLTAEAEYSSTPVDFGFKWNDYSGIAENKQSHAGWTAITSIDQLSKLTAGKYYLDFPDGVGTVEHLAFATPCDGDLTIDLNGNLLMATKKVNFPIASGGSLTIIDTGRNKYTHRFQSSDSSNKSDWTYDAKGDITVQGGCLKNFNISGKPKSLTIYGGNILNAFWSTFDTFAMYGGNLLNSTYIQVEENAHIENSLFAYSSSVYTGKSGYCEVSDCKFFNNNSEPISSGCECKVTDCTFTNCYNAVGIEGKGLITDCTITDCGQALNIYGDTVIKNVTINDSWRAVFGLSCNVTLIGCEINNCKSTLSHDRGGNVTIDNCKINGSGSMMPDCSEFTMNNTELTNMKGSISIGGQDTKYELSSVRITDSLLDSGSGITIHRNQSPDVYIENTEVRNCLHGIDSTYPKSLVVKNSTFTGNKNGIVSKSKNITITDSVFRDHVERALDLSVPIGSNIILKGCSILNTVNDTYKTYAVCVGEGFMTEDQNGDTPGKLYVEDCRFNGNDTLVPLYIYKMKSEIVNSEFKNNINSVDQGTLAIRGYEADITLKGTTVTGNTGTLTGESSFFTGAIEAYEGKLTLDGAKNPCIITGNTCNYAKSSCNYGGGIYAIRSDVKVMGDVTVTGNTITNNGKVTDCNVSLNSGSYIEIDSQNYLSKNSVIGVTTDNGSVTDCVTGYQQVSRATTDDQMTRFVSDKGYNVDMQVIEKAGGSCVVFRGEHDWGEWEESGDKLVRTCKLNKNHTESKDIAKYSISAWAAPMRTGKITASAYEAKAGEKVTLTATPYENYTFDSWTVVKGGITIDETGSFIMPAGDVEIAANFVYAPPESHTVSVWAAPSRSGHVQASADEADVGEVVTLTARPYQNYKFVKWTVVAGDVTIDENNSFVMPNEKVEIMAEFEFVPPTKHTISAWADPMRTGKVTVSAEEAAAGELVTLTARPYDGYRFVKWTVVAGDVTIDESNSFVMPDENVEIVAEFELIPPTMHTISTWADTPRTGKVNVSAEEAAAGEKITLTPVAYQNYKFKEWIVVTENVTIDENNTFVMPDEKVEIVAVFEYAPEKHAISAWADPMRTGKVEVSAEEAAAGEKITLTARPYEGYKFVKWTVIAGDVTIDENNTFVMPDENVEITAVFEYAGETVSLLGDANCDGKVTIADAAAILQYLGNKDRYPLTEQGKKNADCDGTVGITTADAIAIQKYVSGIIDKLG